MARFFAQSFILCEQLLFKKPILFNNLSKFNKQTCPFSSVVLNKSSSIESENTLVQRKQKCINSTQFTIISRNFVLSSILSKEWILVTYQKPDGENTTAKGKEGDNLLDVAINSNVDLDGFGACEGTLSCSTCHLIFKQEDFDKISDPLSDEELDMLDLAYGLSDTLKCVSFAGCGFLSLYLVGAAACIQSHFPNLFQRVSLCGASSGALLAACLACDVPLKTIKNSVLNTAVEAHTWSLGPFSPSFNIEDYLLEGLSHLPHDAHLIASNRVFISLTRVKDLKNVVVSSWSSRDELIQCLLCSCFIPIFSGTKVPSFRGEGFIDGGFSNNLPLSGSPNLTVSAFASSTHVSPKDNTKNPRLWRAGNHEFFITRANIVRLIRALIPLQIEDLETLYQDGFNQADTVLKKHGALKTSTMLKF